MTIENLKNTLDKVEIALERKQSLNKLAEILSKELKATNKVNILFICTHNSRRSQFSQVWCQYIAEMFEFNNITCYSGGTEVTSVYPQVIDTLKEHGFHITSSSELDNPVYQLGKDDEKKMSLFSKLYFDPSIPEKDFVAILTCDEANEMCPNIPGAKIRFPLSYVDPKFSDNTPNQNIEYKHTSTTIAGEMYYVFSKIKELCK